eukprot:tig00000655_g2857.t1
MLAIRRAHGLDARVTLKHLRLLRSVQPAHSRDGLPPARVPLESPRRAPIAHTNDGSALAGSRHRRARSTVAASWIHHRRRYGSAAIPPAPPNEPPAASPAAAPDGDHHFTRPRHPEFVAIAEEYANSNNEHIEHLLDSIASARLQPLSDDELRGIGALLNSLGFGVCIRGPDGSHLYMRRLAEAVASVHGAAFVNDPSQYDLDHFKQQQEKRRRSTSARAAALPGQDVPSALKAAVNEGGPAPPPAAEETAAAAEAEATAGIASQTLFGADDSNFKPPWDQAFEDFLLSKIFESVVEHRAAKPAAADAHPSITPAVLFIGNGCLSRTLLNQSHAEKFHLFLRALEEATAQRPGERPALVLAAEKAPADSAAPAAGAAAAGGGEKAEKAEKGPRLVPKKGRLVKPEKAEGKPEGKRPREQLLESGRRRMQEALRELEARAGVEAGQNWRVMVVGSATFSDHEQRMQFSAQEHEDDDEDDDDDDDEPYEVGDLEDELEEEEGWRQRRSNRSEALITNLQRQLCPQEVAVLPPLGPERAARWADRLARDEKEEIAQQNLHLIRSVLRPLGPRYEELGRDEATQLPGLRAKLGSFVLDEDDAKRLVLMAYTSAQAFHKRAAASSPSSSSSSSSAPQPFPLRFWIALTLGPGSGAPSDERLRSVLPHLDSSEKQLLPSVVRPEDIGVRFEDIGGLEAAKAALHEIVILPLRHPKLFARGNLRRTTRGVLLFGPPGTGKSLLAKALARESGACFLNVSSSSLTSKWFGESEKFGAAIFSLARKLQPCVLFFDEVDSLLGRRHTADHDASRRLQNELMAAWDGFSSTEGERVVVLAATNRPFDLDDAVLRRLPKRVLIDVPDYDARLSILSLLLRDESLAPGFDVPALARSTEGYTGSDLKNLCIAAAYEPVRELLASGAAAPYEADAMRAVTAEDFARARALVRPSVVENSLPVRQLREWNSLHADASSAPPRLFFGFGGDRAQGPRAPSPAPPAQP